MTFLAANPALPCRLIKKTADFIFFEKGSGVHSVAHDVGETNSAANWLLSVDPDLYKIHPLECGLAHRLDEGTSGVMVAARNPESHEHLKNLFRKKEVEKIYFCLTSTKPSLGIFVAFAGKHPKSAKKTGIALTSSQTRLRVKGRTTAIRTEILDVTKSKKNYLVKIRLHTGYRHQIRAHLAALGCAIVGDDLYGGDKAERLMLHAFQLGFTDVNGKRIEAESLSYFL